MDWFGVKSTGTMSSLCLLSVKNQGFQSIFLVSEGQQAWVFWVVSPVCSGSPAESNGARFRERVVEAVTSPVLICFHRKHWTKLCPKLDVGLSQNVEELPNLMAILMGNIMINNEVLWYWYTILTYPCTRKYRILAQIHSRCQERFSHSYIETKTDVRQGCGSSGSLAWLSRAWLNHGWFPC